MIYHMHRNIIITKGLSQQKQVTNAFQFTSISGFQNDWMIIFATKKWAKSEYSTHLVGAHITETVSDVHGVRVFFTNGLK